LKQLYTSCPCHRTGEDNVMSADVLIRRPPAASGIPVEELLTPVARATTDPQLVQCKLWSTHYPSRNRTKPEGRITNRL
jgi:hypothetical protein